MTASTAAPPAVALHSGDGRWRLSIALFSIPLGLAGLGGTWTAAAGVLDTPAAPAHVAYAAAATLWTVFTVGYVVGTVRHTSTSFRIELRHPLLGPLTAYIPVTAVLLSAHYSPRLEAAGEWVTYIAVLALVVNAAALVAHWLTGSLDENLTHPGYLLPVTAGPFIVSIGLVGTGHERAAIAAFGVGSYFSLVLGALITSRVFFGTPLPTQFKPVLSIIVSPPATAGLAWFAITGGHIDALQVAITGVTLFLLLVQLFLIPDYLTLAFTAQHWVFTFPLAVLGTLAIRWSGELGGDGSRAVAWAALSVTSALFLLIAAGTVRDLVRWGNRRAVRARNSPSQP